MLNTVNTKPSHHTLGFFRVGSGPQKILILGSCRVLPYCNYLDWLNADNRFTINLVNVVNFNFDAQDKPRDAAQATEELEQCAELRNMISGVDLFLHEHTESYGMFNTSRECAKNIYQFGMSPAFDVALPNFNNVHVLAQEQVNYDRDFHDLVKADVDKLGRIDDQWITMFRQRGMERIEKFLSFCRLSGLPEFALLFEREWTSRRYFWTGSHISNVFSMEVFRMINDKWLALSLPPSFWERAAAEDPYAEPHTPITYLDVMAFGLTWPQPVEELKL